MSRKKQRTPYSERIDIEKIQSNWRKACRLLRRSEFSSAIIRIATASEIATNLAIREELQVKRSLDRHFVDSLLLWANGIQGKFHRLLLPLVKGTDLHRKLGKVKARVTQINSERNSVVHSGQFKKRSTAKKVVLSGKRVIEVLVRPYDRRFRLPDTKKPSK